VHTIPVEQFGEAVRYKPDNVAGSTLDRVTGIFHGHDPSGHTMILGINSASNRNE
jgi:hypothetical protein